MVSLGCRMSHFCAVIPGEEMELKHFGSENFCFLHGDFVTHITSSLPCVAAQWKGNNP